MFRRAHFCLFSSLPCDLLPLFLPKSPRPAQRRCASLPPCSPCLALDSANRPCPPQPPKPEEYEDDDGEEEDEVDEGDATASGGLKAQVREATAKLERELIVKALAQTSTNVTQAARLLKISRKSLQIKMKELGLREGGG